MDSNNLEMPFMEHLPKREKSKVAKLWDVAQEMRNLFATDGLLFPTRFASGLLGVSQQRVDQLLDAGKLKRVTVDGHPFVTENSLVAHARSERKNGRPAKIASTKRQVFGRLVKSALEK